MKEIAYYSITGQTKRFVNKLGIDGYEITDADPFYQMGRPFILIVPAYDDDMMDPEPSRLVARRREERPRRRK